MTTFHPLIPEGFLKSEQKTYVTMRKNSLRDRAGTAVLHVSRNQLQSRDLIIDLCCIKSLTVSGNSKYIHCYITSYYLVITLVIGIEVCYGSNVIT